MSKQIMAKLEHHDELFAGIKRSFDAIDERFAQVDKRFEVVERRLDRLEEQMDWVIKKLLDHEERLERIEKMMMATRKDIGLLMKTVDRLVALFEKKDKETTLLAYGLQKLEERYNAEMGQVKSAIGLA